MNDSTKGTFAPNNALDDERRCWNNFAFPDRRCKREARWCSPEALCVSVGKQFMRACKWCDEHKHDDDVLIDS